MYIMYNLDLSNKIESVDDIAVECASPHACARDKSNINSGICIATVGL